MLYLDAGASHVVVTSYVFKNGEVRHSNHMKKLSALKNYLYNLIVLYRNKFISIDLTCAQLKVQNTNTNSLL